MIINKIMREIWSPTKEKFDRLYNDYMLYSENEIMDMILKNSSNQAVIAEDSSFNRMTLIPSTGCPHWHQKDAFSGCCFCDNFTDNLKGIALLSVLKDKNEQAYASIIGALVERTRSKDTGLKVVEHITAEDSLCDDTISFEKLIDIYRYGNHHQDMTYLALETRAYNVSSYKLKRLQRHVCKRILIECGMEVGNEWLRNHWLNKGITDQQLIKAIDIIHQERCISNIDILLGIPGLTSLQSKELFIDTFKKAVVFGADNIIVSPLLRKNNNLQNFLYNHFKDDVNLIEEGIVNGEQTGIVDLLTIYDALIELIASDPEYERHLIIAPLRFNTYRIAVEDLYRNSPHGAVVLKLLDGLEQYKTNRNINDLHKVKEDIKNTEYYKNYMQSLNNIKTMKEIKSTLQLVSGKLIRHFWPDEYDTIEAGFISEMEMLIV